MHGVRKIIVPQLLDVHCAVTGAYIHHACQLNHVFDLVELNLESNEKTIMTAKTKQVLYHWQGGSPPPSPLAWCQALLLPSPSTNSRDPPVSSLLNFAA
jgi:hypothetical protein